MRTAKTAAVPAVRVSFFVNILLSGNLLLLLPGALSAQNDQADRLFDRAGQAQNSGDFEFAAELWDKFIKDHPQDPQILKARHYAGVCRMTLKQYDRAVAVFGDVIADEKADKLPQLEESYYYLGWCQFSRGQQDAKNQKSLTDALQTFDRHIKKFAKGKLLDQAYFLKGEALYFLGQKKESIAAYAKVVSDFKESNSRNKALYAMGVSLFETVNYAEAESAFDDFLKEFVNDPLSDEIKLYRAESILQQGLSTKDPDEVRDFLFKAKTSLVELAENESFAKRDEALFNLARCESQLNNWREAARLYAEVAAQFPQSNFSKSASLSAGNLYLFLKDYKNAEKWLQVSITANPATADEAQHWYCQALIRQDKFDAAKQAATRALEKATHQDFSVRLKMDLADALYNIPGDKEKSIAAYLVVVDQHSTHRLAPQSLYNAAFACLELKKFSQGLELSDRFVSEFPKNTFLPDVKYVRGECLLLTQKPGAAAEVYQDLIQNHSSRSDLKAWQVRYGLALYLQDQYEPAVTFLNSIVNNLSKPAQLAEAHFLLGASRFYQNKLKQAIADLQKAVSYGDLLKQIDEGLILLAQAQAGQEQYDPALKLLEQLTSTYTSSSYLPQANYLAGQYLLNGKKNYQGAVKKFDTVLSLGNNKYVPYALYGKAWALLNSEQNEDAKAALDLLIQKHSGHELLVDALYSRGVAHRRLGQFKPAVTDIDLCLEKNPKYRNLVSALYEKGMALSESGDSGEAIKTFQKLTTEFPDHQDADEFHYQLAWAHKSSKQNDAAVKVFRKLTEKFPTSEAVGEAHYHVAEDLYLQKKFDLAINQYDLAIRKAKSSEVAEKSGYKKSWSHYQKKDFDQAREGFTAQVGKFGAGNLADSSRFMIAECWYQEDRFTEAFAEFEKVLPVVIRSEKTNSTEKALACLHAAEAANKIRNYKQAENWIRTLQEDLKDDDYVAECWLELGNSKRGQKQLEGALESFSKAFDLANNETGARAGFLVGEVLFQEKKFDDAIRQYKLVIYGYGGDQAPAEIKKWQCSSGYETARCYHVQIKSQSSRAGKLKMIDDARKFYNYVIQNHAQDRLATESKKQLAVLDKLKL